MRSLHLAAILLWATWVNAQTETVVNAAGATVVEVLTDNAAGVPVTQILQTIVGSTSSLSNPLNPLTSSTPLTSSNPLLASPTAATTSVPVGPVGQPAPTPVEAGGPTPYTYTTTNADGETVALEGIFTPTGPATVLPNPTTTGTVLNYSSWKAMVGTNTVPANAASHISTPISTGWYCLVATTLTGLVGGAWVIMF
ncbi:hypothetical protein HYDPIDRAFT_85163 [Hydnomerulius pinastri MD-312]|nr:hypothetical protein HYDPIDRAFT_85163 [Hydnomerulius pinastri MD-312]